MIYYEITKEGKVISHDGEPDCWMAKAEEWEATEIAEGHYAYYDGQGIYDTENGGIVFINGIRIPTPAFITGSNGEATAAPNMKISEIEALIGV